jgi:hypothetical protein
MSRTIPYIVGTLSLQSELTIEEVGEKLSGKLFGGLKFGGKERAIYDEVPAIFIESNVLSFRIILQGYSGLSENDKFYLTIFPDFYIEGVEQQQIHLDEYLTEVSKTIFQDDSDINILDYSPENSFFSK